MGADVLHGLSLSVAGGQEELWRNRMVLSRPWSRFGRVSQECNRWPFQEKKVRAVAKSREQLA